MRAQLLEVYDFELDDHQELVEHNGKQYLKLGGVFSIGNAVNLNNRVYPTSILQKEVKKFQRRIKSGTALGKAFHPGLFDKGGAGGATDVSHRVVELTMDGDYVRGKLLVFNTFAGIDVKAIIDGGGTLGISSRGYGTTKEGEWDSKKKVDIVQDDYELGTYDIVLNPAVARAQLHIVESMEEGNMTPEDIKIKLPDAYKSILGEGIKRGEESKSGIETDLRKQVTDEKAELEGLKSELSVLKNENEKAKTELDTYKANENKLKEELTVLKKEKTVSDVYAFIQKKLGESLVRGFFTEESLKSMYESSSVKEAEEVFNKQESLIKNISEHIESASSAGKAKKVNYDDDSKPVDAWISEQRRLAGLYT
jgi:hypothetical protein